jgi:DNA-binding transcriptional ArsR family regulator
MANAVSALGALGDSRRRQLFERLAKRPRSVAELSQGLPVSRPAVSQHLKVLKKAGLVTVRKHGTRHFYQVDPRGLRTMRDYLDRFWDTALEAFKASAEEDKGEKNERGKA